MTKILLFLFLFIVIVILNFYFFQESENFSNFKNNDYVDPFMYSNPCYLCLQRHSISKPDNYNNYINPFNFDNGPMFPYKSLSMPIFSDQPKPTLSGQSLPLSAQKQIELFNKNNI